MKKTPILISLSALIIIACTSVKKSDSGRSGFYVDEQYGSLDLYVSPPTPLAGNGVLYHNGDKSIYKDDAGIEYLFDTFDPTLDTAFIRDLSLKGKEWAYIMGSLPDPHDSLYSIRAGQLKAKLRAAVKSIPGSREVKREANIVIDTVYVRFAKEFWKLFLHVPQAYTNYILGTNALSKLNQVTHAMFIEFKLAYNASLQRDCDAVLSRGELETLYKQ